MTPLSQIPERAIHAAPFQPTHYPQPGFYGQPYPMMQPMQPPQGYYYPPQYGGNMGPNASAPVFIPSAQQAPPLQYNQSIQGDPQEGQLQGQAAGQQGLIAQEMGGTMYYYDPNQIPVNNYPPYPPAYNPAMVNMGGGVTPDQNGLFFPPPAPGMVYQ